MIRKRPFVSWLLAVASVAAFVVGASAQQVARAVSRAVVTPDDPIWADQQQNPTTPPQDPQEQTQTAPGRGGRAGAPAQPRPYAQVITATAKTDKGIFTLDRVGENLYYEIPKFELGKDYLWVSQIKSTTLGAGYGGQAVNNRVVRWEQLGNRVLMKIINYGVIASDKTNPIVRAVNDANVPEIMASFNVEAFNPAGDPVIDVTRLFTSEIPELSARTHVGGRGFDASRTFIDKAMTYPTNVNVEVTQTYTAPLQDAAAAGGGGGGGRGAAAGMRGNSGTIVMYYSMVKLPETPMQPRLFDDRVGYFTTSTYDYSRPEHKADQRVFITRYRLEKKDPTAALSEPVKPIVYYVDPATPTKWVPWVKKAIEDWEPAFEAAGFKNAIIAKEAPKDDPDWSKEDARYSVIDWLPSTTENSVGPHIVDPRSGEIIEADVQIYHNVMNLATMWYFTQVGDLDPRAKKLPLPDDLQGRLIEYVIAHEVGHTLGFQHNMKASSEYTLAQVRDKNWVHENGHTPTLMDYSRFNYVAQPEDGIAVDDLIPKIGPYDKWATMWGYKPIAASSPDDEKKTLDQWAHEQDSKPYLRFSTAGQNNSDPGDETEAVGDADAAAATALGMKNLSKVAGMMLDATSTPGESYDDLTEVYGRIVSQWTTEMNHVTNEVGGMLSQEKYVGQQGVRFTPEPKAKQQAAVQFLLDNAFHTPDFLVNQEVLRRIQPTGVVNRMRTAQNSVMNSLLQPQRLDRLVEQSALDANAYTPVQFLGDVRKGIWSELATPAKPIDTFRRNTQRVYLDTIDNRLNESGATSDEVRALLKGELKTLDTQIKTALPAVTDTASKRHLEDARDQIAEILDPRAMRTPPAAVAGGGRRGGGAGQAAPGGAPQSLDWSTFQKFDYDHDPFLQPPDGCWPDLIIR